MEAPRRSASRPLILVGALFIVGVLGVVAWSVELPYLAFDSGPVADASDTIVAEEVEVYPPNGELLVLTVVSQDVNLFEVLIAGADPNIDLVPKAAVVRKGETDEEYRNRVLAQMDDSNNRSIRVALEYLGYELVPVEVVINDVVEGTPASSLLKAGDTIVAINGTPITAVSDITAMLEDLQVGDVVAVTVDREGETMTLSVELARRDDEVGGPIIGVVVGELTDSPFPLAIAAGNIGGPSAGLMHTLAIIDLLTEGELTKGHVIAGTGTISADGTVGNIGGIRQKVVAAEAAGASYILVPEGNAAQAATAQHSRIQIVPVDTIHDAIDFLESLEAA